MVKLGNSMKTILKQLKMQFRKHLALAGCFFDAERRIDMTIEELEEKIKDCNSRKKV